MTDLYWVLAANAVVWLGLGLYLARLCRARARLTRRLRQLDARRLAAVNGQSE